MLPFEYVLNRCLSEKVRGRQTTTPESIVRELDIKLDAGWAGLHSFLSGFTRLPADFVESTKAASVLDRVYPDGLKFTQTPYSVEWGESESKLQTIKKEKLESVIVELGGRAFLAAIGSAHDNYGRRWESRQPPPQRRNRTPPRSVRHSKRQWPRCACSWCGCLPT